MKKEDIHTLLQQSADIVKAVALQTKEQYRPAQRATGMDMLFDQFHTANEFARTQLQSRLHTLAPFIPWSDAEFDPEEQHHPDDSRAYWVCDPIDGAVQFLQDCYPWCVSLALVSNGSALFSVVYDAERDELFTALRGGGAYVNGARLEVNPKARLADCIVCTAHPNAVAIAKEEAALFLRSFQVMLPAVAALRIPGPASLMLAWVAAGRTDGYWEYGDDIYDWLAGALLVQEAGGSVCTASGQPLSFAPDGIVAGAPAVCRQIQELLTFKEPGRRQ